MSMFYHFIQSLRLTLHKLLPRTRWHLISGDSLPLQLI